MKESRRKKTSTRPTRAGKGPGPAPASVEEVARRAYELYLARGGEPGREQEDWLQAERELRQKAGS